jgi:L-ascorbate 6-phosphate lactonase
MLSGRELIADIETCEVRPGQCAFWWLGQHGFALKLGKTVLYVDAYITPSKARNVPPLLKSEEITNASGVLGTHDHSDHIDRPAWPGIAGASPNAIFVVPRRVREKVSTDLGIPAERIVGLDEGIETSIGEVKITAVPAAHELLDIDDTGASFYLGYIIQGNGFTAYHAGDTCIYEGLQTKLKKWKFDLAFLPINGRDAARLKRNCLGNMTFQEAVDLAGAIRPQLTIPTHFEMFNGNTENPEQFMDYLKIKYPDLRAQIPVHGQRVIVSA